MTIDPGNYRYVIIVDRDYKTYLWNEGNLINGIQEINFSAEVDALPELIIKKV